MSAEAQAPGRFITVEGGEGAGKSTHTAALAERLRARGIAVVTTREPGGTAGGEAIRALLTQGDSDRWDGLSELLLLLAARHQHVAEVIAPALARGAWVLCDRFIDSTMAYQGYGMGLDRDLIARLHALVVGRPQPDKTLILDVPVTDGLKRAAGRDPDASRYEAMNTAFHTRVRDGFLAIARAEPERCVVIDATAARDVVAARIDAALVTLLEPDNSGDG